MCIRDSFYIMHRFYEEERIPFIKKMQSRGLFTSISVGVKGYEYDFVKQLAEEKLNPDYITTVSYTHLTLPTKL
ncbi:GMP reductase, partial [Enterococcus sp. S181_ASV_20]|nr:GMP reductase [Enterococcus sp. S181_ASV_20]